MKIAISLTISAPGAGKGTQAELLANELGLIHFDTGKYLERLLHSPEAEKDPILKREQINFDTGKLTTPEWILGQAKKEAEKIATSGQGLIFSGSPRTLYETFGDEKEEGLANILVRLYGKENVYFIKLDIDEETTIERNSKRMVCSVERFSILTEEDEERCRALGGLPEKRKALDDPEIIRERLKEYRERTFPIIRRLKEEGYNVIEIDGRPFPDEVFDSILRELKIEKQQITNPKSQINHK
ncbi:MAG: nucleoside monophosphate kinase [Nanoarchaeota archaeon]|nr:nucleoside monophosphate kinase [Nanoarchaeota archaeon]